MTIHYVAAIGTTKLDKVSQYRYDAWSDRLEELAINKNNHLVTGGALGCDERSLAIWYRSNNYNCTVFLPYSRFNSKELSKYNKKGTNYITVLPNKNSEAYEITKQHHPAPEKLNSSTINFHARNYLIANLADEIIALPEFPLEEECTYENLKNKFGGTLQTCRLGLVLNKKIETF